MPRYWVIPVSEENWHEIKRLNIYGAPEPQGPRKPAYQLIKPGDILIFYVTKKGSKSLGEKFVGAYRVTSTWYREDEPLWPDEIRERKVKYPWRVKLEPVKIGEASFKELVYKLRFATNKERPAVYLVGTPANMGRPIPEEDAKLIINSLK